MLQRKRNQGHRSAWVPVNYNFDSKPRFAADPVDQWHLRGLNQLELSSSLSVPRAIYERGPKVPHLPDILANVWQTQAT